MATNLTTIGDRIRHARNHGPAGKVSRKDLAAAAGIAYSTLADVENNLSNNTTALHKVAKRLRVRVEWLETGKGPMEAPMIVDESDENWPPILAYRQAAALGSGQVVDEYAETHKLKFRAESLRRKHLKAEKLAVIYGKGDSMHPTIRDGDAILIDTGDRAPRDGKLYVISEGNELMAKRLVGVSGEWFAMSDNPAYKPRKLEESNGVRIEGRVQWVAGWVD